MKFFIAAAGFGTRMNNHFDLLPKPLYPYKGFPIIGHLLETYKKYSNNIVVAVNDCSRGMLLKGWLEDYYKNPDWLSFHIQDHPRGTAHLLRSAGLIGEQVCVSWADFIYESNFKDVYESLDGTTFAIADIECRYSVIDGKIMKGDTDKDGLFGFYYFDEMPELDETHEGILENFSNEVVNIIRADVISLGTEQDFLDNGANDDLTTLNYDVKIIEDVVIKSPLTAKESVENEYNWYNNAPESLKPHLPDPVQWTGNSLIMGKCKGWPLTSGTWYDDFWDKQLPNFLDDLHVGERPIVKSEIYDMYYSKPVKRVLDSEQVINSIVDFNISDFFNGIYGRIGFPNYYTWVHHDLTLSNMFLGNRIEVIDPKGVYYGDPRYDIAKMFYSIMGFEHIKRGDFKISKNGGVWEIEHGRYDNTKKVLWFMDWALERYDISKDCMNAMLKTIWLSATGYFLYNPMLVLAFYIKGMER